MRQIVYDTGMLIAIEGGAAKAYGAHRVFLDQGVVVIVPAVVAAQAVRTPARQARLMRTLSGSSIEPFTRAHHVAVGRLLAASGTCDVVDAFVVLLAASYEAGIYTSDVGDIRHLVDTLGVELPVLAA